MKKDVFTCLCLAFTFCFIPNLLQASDMCKPLYNLRDYNATYSGVIESGSVSFIGGTLFRDNQDNGSLSGCIGEGCGSHPGIDIPIQSGAHALACGSGSIIFANLGDNGGFGGLLVLEAFIGQDVNPVYCVYGHLRKIFQTSGWVSSCQALGETGGGLNDLYRGHSTGAHLHFQIDKSYRGFPYWPSRQVNEPDINPSVIEEYVYNPMVFLQESVKKSSINPSDYTPIFDEYYENMKDFLGEKVGGPYWLDKQKFPGVIAHAYQHGKSAYSSNDYPGHSLLILDIAGGNDFFPVLLHSGFLEEFYSNDGKCGVPITPEYDNSYDHSRTESRQEFKNNCYYYWKDGVSDISVKQDSGYISPGMGERGWIGDMDQEHQVSYQMSRSYFLYSDARNELGKAQGFSIYGHVHSPYVHNLFPSDEEKSKKGAYGQPFVFPGTGMQSYIIYNPEVTSITKAFVIKGEVFRVYAHEVGFADGPLGLPTGNEFFTNSTTIQQNFQFGYIIVSQDTVLAIMSDGSLLYKEEKGQLPIRTWAEDNSICNAEFSSGEEEDPCYPHLFLEKYQLFLAHDESGEYEDALYISYDSKLALLPTHAMQYTWQQQRTPMQVPYCFIRRYTLTSIDLVPSASFPEGAVVHRVKNGGIYLKENNTWRRFADWTTYMYNVSKGLASGEYVDVSEYEFEFFPAGQGIQYECPEHNPHIPQHTVVQVADYDGALTDWYFLHHSDKMLWIPTENIRKSWLLEGPSTEVFSIDRCIMDRISKDDILNYPEIIFPEGFSVIHQTSGKVLVKNNNQWHYVTDPVSWKYYREQFGLKEQVTSIDDYEFSLLPLGKNWSKPLICPTSFFLPYGTLMQTTGDDGNFWPYRYIMYHGQLVYTTRDSQWQSWGSENMFVPINYCIVLGMNPIPVDKIPIASFKPQTVVHHSPTGNIYILDAYEWHLFPTWDDYMYFRNTYGISENRIDIGDKDLAFYPIGYNWIKPVEETVDPPQKEKALYNNQEKKEFSEESGSFFYQHALQEKVESMLDFLQKY